MSRTLAHASAENRPILESALRDHEKHYRALCAWVTREIKKSARNRRWQSGPEALTYLLAEGFTAATVIWETYSKSEDRK